MSDSTPITSRDSKGQHIVGLFEVALNNTKLDSKEAQSIIEQGGVFQRDILTLLRFLVSNKPSEGSKRIQFEFSSDAYRRLNDVKNTLGAASFAELVRNALRVYEWLVEQEKAGYEIGLVKDEKLTKTVKLVF